MRPEDGSRVSREGLMLVASWVHVAEAVLDIGIEEYDRLMAEDLLARKWTHAGLVEVRRQGSLGFCGCDCSIYKCQLTELDLLQNTHSSAFS
jgi:hypothetical protein